VIASGLPRIRPMQDLRHTHATLLIGEGGVNVKVVQERLGHHSHSFTADTYQHVIPGMDEAAARPFDDLVFGRRTHTWRSGTRRRAAPRSGNRDLGGLGP
jgi:integrase